MARRVARGPGRWGEMPGELFGGPCQTPTQSLEVPTRGPLESPPLTERGGPIQDGPLSRRTDAATRNQRGRDHRCRWPPAQIRT